jgi:hypothetical protein
VLGNILLGIDGDTGLALMTKRLIEVGSKENAPRPPARHTAKTLARDDRNKDLSAHPSTGSDERLSKRSRSKFFSSL